MLIRGIYRDIEKGEIQVKTSHTWTILYPSKIKSSIPFSENYQRTKTHNKKSFVKKNRL